MNNKTGLVLEGGGFRGIYSAGVLDYFLIHQVEIPYVIGVSMGACNAVNYISGQVGRNLNVPYTYIGDKRYMSYQRLLCKGQLFGMDFIFGDIPHKLIPFDFDAYYRSKQEFVVVTTDCVTGKPHYVADFKNHDLLESLKASTSLPFASKMIRFKNKLLLDGGISDPIPIEKALKDGCDKVVVILTQPDAYRKKPANFSLFGKLMYKKYPQLIYSLNERNIRYNEALDQIKVLEKEGKAFVIRPQSKLPISRTEKNKEKLKETFEIGYQQMDGLIDDLRAFMK